MHQNYRLTKKTELRLGLFRTNAYLCSLKLDEMKAIRWIWTAMTLLSLHAYGQSQLDSRHLLLDGSLSDAEAAGREHVYNNIQKAMRHLGDSATLYIKPWVYWVDDPDDPEVRVGQNGREPFGMVVTAKKLRLIGLGDDPRDVVLASQRGQTQGAVGNFTMLDFHVDDLTVENMTLGNYCNVDLDYPLRPELSRQRRSDAITQAHVGYVHGRRLTARRVRFISRLNLNPLNGAQESLYDSCHFECTDDALNGGRALYRHCTFDLYGQKPWWSTSGAGPMLVDCDFYVKSDNREMVFCKQGGPLTLVDCRYHGPDSIYIGWTSYPQPWLRCYLRGFTLNGRPYLIGNRQPENSVCMDVLPSSAFFEEGWPKGGMAAAIPHLPISQHEARLRAPARLVLRSERGVTWSVPPAFAPYAQCYVDGDSVAVSLTNDTNTPVSFCISAHTADGREAACHIELQPSLLPPPLFEKEPTISIKDGVARLDYALLQDEGLRDESDIVWRRVTDEAPFGLYTLAGSNEGPQRTYRLMPGDNGHRLAAIIMPRHQRSDHGQPVMVLSATLTEADIAVTSVLDTDFSSLPVGWQQGGGPDTWTVDGYKPLDTADYDWSFDPAKPMWAWTEGFNGAVGRGLVQAQRGARLMYSPGKRDGNGFRDMSLTLEVDPTKTAGQGFGSATGQYMDVCLKFDTETLTGYGLRIIRTTKHAKAVDFLLVAYEQGRVRPLTEGVSATCYRTGCTIRLDYAKGKLAAHVSTKTPRPAGSDLPHEVSLQAEVNGNPFGGICIQHTGSCGESTTMLHHLTVCWE